MAEELDVGKIVARIVIEVETKQAEEQVNTTVESIKSALKNINVSESEIKIETKQAEQQAKQSTDNVKKEIQSIENTNAQVDIDTKQAEQQIKKTIDDIKSDIKSVESTNVQVNVDTQQAKQQLTDYEKLIYKLKKDFEISTEEAEQRLKQFSEKAKEILLKDYRTAEEAKFLDREIGVPPSRQGPVVDFDKIEADYKSVTEAVEKSIEATEREKAKLAQLENQYDRTQTTQDNYVNRKIASYERGVVATENAANREIAAQQRLQNQTSKADTTMMFADLTTSLRTFNSVSPTAIDNISTIVRQINLLRRASQSGASTGIIALTSMLAVFGTIATIVVNTYNNIKAKQEETIKTAVKSSEAYEENSKSISKLTEEYTKLKNSLDNAIKSETDILESKEKLKDIQNQLVETYGKEADGIDLVNGKLDEEIEKIAKLNQEEAKNYVIKNKNAYTEATQKLATVNDYKIEIDTSENLDKIFIDELGGFRDGNGYKIRLSTGEAEQTLYNLYDKIENTLGIVSTKTAESISTALNSINGEDIDNFKKIIENYETAIKTSIGKNTDVTENLNNEIQETYTSINDNIKVLESLSSVYDKLKDNSKDFDTSTLIELLDLYPKLTQYIAQTGDLSLENGEKIKQVQQELLQSNINQLAQEKAVLDFKENKTAEEEKMLQKINATLSIYKQSLADINSGTAKLDISAFKTDINSLGSAYSSLADKKELDLNTTLDLIEKYPEFAKALNNGSKSVDEQRKTIEQLFETKKNEMLTSLKADEQELQSLVKTNKAEIKSLKDKMEAYSMVSSVVTECKMQLSQLNEKSESYTTRLNQVKSQISAINNLNIESYKSTEKSASKTNERLQEQLNLIEHRRALNNLSYAEEISWLQMLYKEYTETAEERMSLEEKIYTAQQNAIKEQEQAYSDLYNTQLQNLEHLKNLDQLTKEQELAWLNTLYSQYVLTAEERMSLEEKIYSVQKEIQDEKEQAIKDSIQAEFTLLEHEKAMDRLSAENEIAWLERINQSYDMSAEDRMSLEEKIYNAQKSYEKEIADLQQKNLDDKINALEKARSTTKITYEEEIRQLKEIYRTQKLTLEQQEQLLDQIRSIQKNAKSDRSSQFSSFGDGVVEALKNRYQEQRDIEEEMIKSSIESWKKWEDETVKAIQSQIDALDELADTQKSEDERREYENKRQATELLLKYEKDDYNRKQYIKELNRLDNDEADRLAEEQRKQQKKSLQEQMEAVKTQSQEQQDLLNTELGTIEKNYDKLMSSYSLENEAYKMMLSKSQNEIISFISAYAPEYELTGQTLGEKLYQGLKSKIQNIDYYFQQLGVKWQYYSNQTSSIANKAVDDFWNSRAQYEQKLNTMSSTPTSVNLTVNFNEPVQSPIETARKMEEVTNNLVNQLKR